MAFSRAQQAVFQAMKRQAEAKFRAMSPGVSPEVVRAWYEAELFAAAGVRSTKDCNPAEDFESVMRRFEWLADAGIVWALKAAGANIRRIRYSLSNAKGTFRKPDAYIEAVAEKVCGEEWRGMDLLTKEQRKDVVAQLAQQMRREADRIIQPTTGEDPY